MRAALALAVGSAGAIAGLSAAWAAEGGFAPIDLKVQPFPAFTVGPGSGVEYRGGLILSSSNHAFGSWSGLDFAADGSLYSIADDGQWLRLRVVESGGVLTGVTGAMMAPLLDDAGHPIRRKVDADAEGLRFTIRNGKETALVSLEQRPDVRAFAGPNFVTAVPEHLPLPPVTADLPDNLGLEAIAVAPAASGLGGGSIVVIAEHFLDAKGNHRGFIIEGPHQGEFSLRRGDDYDVSDAAFLPNGDLLVLERKFAFPAGFSMRLVRIPAALVGPGALLDGPTLLEAGAAQGIDNMEGLAVRPQPDGSALIDLISDDNHSFLERTILLEFAVKPSAGMTPRLRPSDAAIQ